MTSTLEEFKSTKRTYKKDIQKLEEFVETIDDENDFKRLSKLVMDSRELKMKTEKQLLTMQKRWEFLDPSDKAHYKQKLTRF